MTPADAGTAAGEPGPEVVLRLDGITKRFGGLLANDGISLSLRRGEVLALLGENGAGKTTLMNVLFGHYVADAGRVEAFGRPLPPGSPRAALGAGIGMVHQHFALAENLGVLDNVILGTEPLWRPWSDRGRARRRLLDLAGRFGLAVDPDARVGALSVGERQRVEILKALYRDARILILDEPTAVLTPQEAAGLFATLGRLTGEGLSVIFISHKLHEVLAASHAVAVLRGGRLVAQVPTSGTTRAELAELMVGRPVAAPRSAPIAPGEPVLELRGASVAGPHGRPALDAVDLTVRRHEILGIAGVSGNGQTALAGLLSGTERMASGRMALLGEEIRAPSAKGLVRRGVGRIPEDRHATGLVADMAVWENLIAERHREPRFARLGFRRRRLALDHARALLRRFDVRGPGPLALTRLLSGGNMQKLILGRTLSENPSLIVASQPTRGLDIGAVTYVQERLLEARAAGAAVILISEDLDEILDLCDRVAVMHRGRLSPPLPRAEATVARLGLLMAGHWDDRPATAADAQTETAHAP